MTSAVFQVVDRVPASQAHPEEFTAPASQVHPEESTRMQLRPLQAPNLGSGWPRLDYNVSSGSPIPARARPRPQVCTVDGKWINVPTAEEETRNCPIGRWGAPPGLVWGAGPKGGSVRAAIAEDPLLITLFDNIAIAMGVPVVDNTPNNPHTRMPLREALDETGLFGDFFSGAPKLLMGGHYGPAVAQGKCKVRLPEDAAPGQMLTLPVPRGWPKEGEMFTFTVPPDAKPGDMVLMPLPYDELSDKWLTSSRSCAVIKNSQQTRLRMLELRKSKSSPCATQPRLEAGGDEDDACACVQVATNSLCSAEMEMETCAVCQVEVASDERVLACKSCNNGFHVRCLNKWLLRADTCPCCRTTISAC